MKMLEGAAAWRIRTVVNGAAVDAEVEGRRLLADFLREDLELRGTHVGCEQGVCGSCTVLINGEPVRSCLMLSVQADGADITTVEGLARGRNSTLFRKPSAGTTRSSVAIAQRASF